MPHARWSLGRWGVPFNIISLIYLAIVFVISFFPPNREVGAEDMQWSSLIFGSVVIFSIVYYYAVGKNHYDGPVVLVKKD